MRNLALFMILVLAMLVQSNAQTISSPDTLKWTVEDPFRKFELSVPRKDANVRIELLPNGFKAICFPDPRRNTSEWMITWKAVPIDSFIEMETPDSLKIRNNLRFSLAANPQIVHDTLIVLERRKFSQLLKTTIIPGGARFQNDTKAVGLFVGALEVASIPLWFYFNDRRESYLNKAVESAKNGDREGLDHNYDKSQKFRSYRDLNGAVFVGTFLFNLLDSILNVKTRVCLRPQDLRKEGLKIRTEIKKGEMVCHIEKAL